MLYIFEDCVLDLDKRELRRDATPVAVEPQVFDLLAHLVRHREHVVSRDELIGSIWGGRIVSESALNTRINAARSAIGDSGTEQRLIKTLPRKGIRFVGDVREQCRASGAPPADASESRAVDPIRVHQDHEGPPARPAPGTKTNDSHSVALSQAVPAPPTSRRFALLRSSAGALTRISETIQMTSREDYQAARELRQWAVDLDRHNATALANLTFAISTGVLNHWSDDEIADLHAADLALQDALAIAPENMRVRGAQCQIMRAMRQFQVAIQACGELAERFPEYAFLHKEIGYDKLMMGEPDEALAEFLEANRLEPDSRLRWSWR